MQVSVLFTIVETDIRALCSTDDLTSDLRSVTALLRFVPISEKVLTKGLKETIVSPEHIFADFHAAQAAAKGPILVYESDRLPRSADPVKLIISEARNGAPYEAPQPIAAGGGYVIRRTRNGVEVLLIFRRGVWDLPKGKLDGNESREEGALREVEEEVGAKDLRIVRDLGTTVHDYRQGSRYIVKTTHWFEMVTLTKDFVPQAEEGIRDVRWWRWDDAKKVIGFDTLRAHMDSLDY